MTLEQLLEWSEIGARIAKASPKRFEEIRETLRDALEAMEIIAEHDYQLFTSRGRPSKRYEA